ncbi:hypothetical protein G5S52_12395 [Grimontia sp. S25]|uniref:Lipocalin-like domain-containing protein n=1 Tax=Grimontia sedimenti TaxID=2711294 RepID=A0A6M1RKS7_9GAMM|nr:hypothetical protein [Grimontia sedimenti]NGN98418.1 hypothetical protein [Grimontia sedimenti]
MLKLVFLLFALPLFVFASSELPAITEAKPILTIEQKQLRASFLGEWESLQNTEGGNIRRTHLTRSADGRYVVRFEFSNHDGDIVNETTEYGDWGVSGDIYFTIFKGWLKNGTATPSDPYDAYNYDAYKILRVTENTLVIKNLTSGNKFYYKRLR